MRELKFQNPTFRPGLNTTVRLGEKWRDLEIGELVKIGPDETAEITLICVHRLKDITKFIVVLEHDLRCQTYRGLIDTLKAIYPELGEQNIEYAIVTSIGFMPSFDGK